MEESNKIKKWVILEDDSTNFDEKNIYCSNQKDYF